MMVQSSRSRVRTSITWRASASRAHQLRRLARVLHNAGINTGLKEPWERESEEIDGSTEVYVWGVRWHIHLRPSEVRKVARANRLIAIRGSVDGVKTILLIPPIKSLRVFLEHRSKWR